MNIRLLSVPLVILGTISCSGTSATSGLTRPAALKIIKASERSSHVLDAYTVTTQLHSAIFVDDSEAGAPENMQRMEAATFEFYESIAKFGLIKREDSCTDHASVEHRTYYCYAPVQPYSLMRSCGYPQCRGTTTDFSLAIVLATVSQEVVTGIAEDSSHTSAQVEIEYDTTPVPIFQGFSNTVRYIIQKYGDDFEPPWVPNPSDITKKSTRTVFLRKFDDGWRIAM